jgi:hypothetical protein
MDERQQQIREGAGLEESRLNQEFIDFLQKWSMPLLVIAAIAAVGYAGWGKVKAARQEKVNAAFREFEAASQGDSPSPETLRRIADDFDGIRGVGSLARLAAADAYLRTVRSGVRPGTQLNDDGTLKSPEDALSPQDAASALDQAKALYQRTYDETASDSTRVLVTIHALYGLASVAESKKDFGAARSSYETLARLAEGTPYAAHGLIAKKRSANVDRLAADVPIYGSYDLTALPPKKQNEIGPPWPPPPALATPPSNPGEIPGPVAPPEAPKADEKKPDAPVEGEKKPDGPAPAPFSAPAPTPAAAPSAPEKPNG